MEEAKAYPVADAAIAQLLAIEEQRRMLWTTIRNAVGAPADYIFDAASQSFIPPAAEDDSE